MDRFTTKKKMSPAAHPSNGGGAAAAVAAATGNSFSNDAGDPSPTAPDVNGADGTTGADSSSSAAAVVSVILSRSVPSSDGGGNKSSSSSASTAPVRLAVAVRTPRKRTNHADTVRFTLEHFDFLDDRRRFTNLDSLLTRLGVVDCVFVGCTESAVVSNSSRSSSGPSQSQVRRAREVSDLLSRLADVINSRTDVLREHIDDGDAAAGSSGPLAQIVPTLPKPLHGAASAGEFVDRTMTHLLGGEGTDRHIAYRGDRALMSDPLPKRALGLLLLRTHEATAADGGTVASDESTRGAYQIRPGALSSFLVLDRTAAETVNLLPPRGGSASGVASCLVGGTDSNNSIYGVLNKCKTRMGGKALETWLRQPLVDLPEIVRRQDAVEALVNDGLGRDRLRDEGLGALASLDLDRLTARLVGAVAAAAEEDEDGRGGGGGGLLGIGPTQALEVLYKMHVFADKQLPALVEALTDVAGGAGAAAAAGRGEDKEETKDASESGGGGDGDKDKSALQSTLDGLHRVNSELGRCTSLVEAVLDFDAAPREFLVKASFSEDLGDVRRDLDEVDIELERLHREMNELWSDVSGQPDGSVRLESGDAGGDGGTVWQFRLPSTNDSKKLQEEMGDQVKVHRVLKNGVYFTTKDLRELGTRKQDLLAEYDRHQRGVVANAMTVGCTYAPVLERASVLIAELDVLASLAYVAAYSPHGYVRPTMTDTDEDGAGIDLREARHPCVELQDSVAEFIPNDLRLVYGESSFLIVTGPNMGGKSTYIRSLGAIITMAQIGSFVPCSSARINVVHHILARVGAGDVQDRGISTFMAEMLEASSILQTATKRSLIIVDELGRGTSTFDGYGLARAISEYIVQRIGCMTVFATHFHELTVLEEREKCVKNCHVTAQRATDGSNGLTFLYEVRPGPCLDSFGIAVGEMANLPPAVIADAKRKAKQLENFDYRKKREQEEEAAADADTNGDAHVNAEEQAEAMNFVNDFRKVQLKSLTVEERREAMRNLISTHS